MTMYLRVGICVLACTFATVLVSVHANQKSAGNLADKSPRELSEIATDSDKDDMVEEFGKGMLNLIKELEKGENQNSALCGTRQYRCRNEDETQSQCVEDWMRCDGSFDCDDRSDEQDCANYTCHKGLVKCKSQLQCIAREWLCDRYVDCFDGSDEVSKFCESMECATGMVKCDDDKQCYENKWTCDGVLDCATGSDEKNCHAYKCDPGWEKCADGKQCVNMSWVCDGRKYCADGSDEQDCGYEADMDWTLCLEGVTSPCANGKQCFMNKLRCDGIEACSDGSDEWDCEPHVCGEEMVKCMNNKQCIYLEWLCDGEVQCDDGSDEALCDNVAPETSDHGSASEDEEIISFV
ncbi:uncharacterized protein LOC144450883 [Glandiceps talaboti]